MWWWCHPRSSRHTRPVRTRRPARPPPNARPSVAVHDASQTITSCFHAAPTGHNRHPLPPRCSSVHLLSSSEAARSSPRVLSISRLEKLIGPPPSDLGDAGDHRRQLALRQEKLGGPDLDRIGDRNSGERG